MRSNAPACSDAVSGVLLAAFMYRAICRTTSGFFPSSIDSGSPSIHGNAIKPRNNAKGGTVPSVVTLASFGVWHSRSPENFHKMEQPSSFVHRNFIRSKEIGAHGHAERSAKIF